MNKKITPVGEELEGFPQCQFFPHGLKISPSAKWDDWVILGKNLFRLREQKERELQTVYWWIGDYIHQAELRFGSNDYAQLVEETGLHEKTLMNIAWVASSFADHERRHLNLTFSHHAEVAGLDSQEDADRLLEQAENENWTAKELRYQRQLLQAHNDGKNPCIPQLETAMRHAVDTLDRIDRERWPELIVTHLIRPLRWCAGKDDYLKFVSDLRGNLEQL